MNAGNVVSVRQDTIETQLTVDAPAGTTTLTVADALDFLDDGGDLSLMSLDSGVSEELSYTSADDEAGTITLDAALGTGYLAGDVVAPLPTQLERYAEVRVENHDETLVARVPHALWDKLPTGVRDASADELELVELDRDADGELIVADVLARAAKTVYGSGAATTKRVEVSDDDGLTLYGTDGVTKVVHIAAEKGTGGYVSADTVEADQLLLQFSDLPLAAFFPFTISNFSTGGNVDPDSWVGFSQDLSGLMPDTFDPREWLVWLAMSTHTSRLIVQVVDLFPKGTNPARPADPPAPTCGMDVYVKNPSATAQQISGKALTFLAVRFAGAIPRRKQYA